MILDLKQIVEYFAILFTFVYNKKQVLQKIMKKSLNKGIIFNLKDSIFLK